MLTRPQYSAAQGAPGVSPGTLTNVTPVGRGRGNLRALLASEERRHRSHQLNQEYLALRDVKFQPITKCAETGLDIIEIGDDDGDDDRDDKVSLPVEIKIEPGTPAIVPAIMSPLVIKSEPDVEIPSAGGEVPSTSTQATEDVDIPVDVIIGDIGNLLDDEPTRSAHDSEDEEMDTQATDTVDLALQKSMEELSSKTPDPDME